MSPRTRRLAYLSTLTALTLLAACNPSEAKRAELPAPKTSDPNRAATTPGATASAHEATLPSETGRTAKTTLMTGTTEPHRRSIVATKVPGIIEAVYVVDGQEVLAGDKLASLDTSDYRLRVRAAEAALNLARIQRAGLEREWKRTQKLVATKAAPGIQLDTLGTQLDAAKGGIAQAEIGVAMARKALKDTVIVAPFAGLVTQKMVSEGQWAGAMPPTPIAMLEEVSTIDLRFDVPELWMDRVAVGTPTTITFAANGETRDAKVTRVVPSLNPRSRSFPAIIELDNADKKLRPGMFAEVKINVEPKER